MPADVKLIKKLLFKPTAITIRDIRRLLELFDYQERKKSGSECLFHKKGTPPINVPTVSGRYVKSPYVKRLINLLSLEEWYEKNKRE